MSAELSLEGIKALVEYSKKPRVTDTRLVVNRGTYDNYQSMFGLTDGQMDSLFIVDMYVT